VQFFPKGDCWGGGGLFTGERQFWLNQLGSLHERGDLADRSLRGDGPHPVLYFGGECPGVYYPRLQREGWELVGHRSKKQKRRGTIFERDIGSYKVVKTCREGSATQPGRGCYWDEHALVYGDERRPLDCDWLDTWQGQVYWVRAGCLYGGELTSAGLVGHLIQDFNDMAFEAAQAPY